MENWIQLSATDVLTQFNDSETAAYDTSTGDVGGANLEFIVAAVCDQIRAAWRNGGRLVSPVSLAIPPGEKNRAIAAARWKYLLALPTGKSLCTDERKAAHDEAEKYWMLIAGRKEIKSPGGVGIVRPGHRPQPYPTGTGGCPPYGPV